MQGAKETMIAAVTAFGVLLSGVRSVAAIVESDAPAKFSTANEPVNAAITIFRHILQVEATIEDCNRIDIEDGPLYEELYDRYRREVSQTAMMVGALVGHEARRSGMTKKVIFESIKRSIGISSQKNQYAPTTDPAPMLKSCRDLPAAIVSETTPFEPLERKFSKEITNIRDWWELNMH